MGNAILNKKGQGTLEMAFVIIIMLLLVAGVFNIWIWANNQIVRRQVHYNMGRVSAGTSADTYDLADHWPVYAPESLTEDMVVKDAPL